MSAGTAVNVEAEQLAKCGAEVQQEKVAVGAGVVVDEQVDVAVWAVRPIRLTL